MSKRWTGENILRAYNRSDDLRSSAFAKWQNSKTEQWSVKYVRNILLSDLPNTVSESCG